MLAFTSVLLLLLLLVSFASSAAMIGLSSVALSMSVVASGETSGAVVVLICWSPPMEMIVEVAFFFLSAVEVVDVEVRGVGRGCEGSTVAAALVLSISRASLASCMPPAPPDNRKRNLLKGAFKAVNLG